MKKPEIRTYAEGCRTKMRKQIQRKKRQESSVLVNNNEKGVK